MPFFNSLEPQKKFFFFTPIQALNSNIQTAFSSFYRQTTQFFTEYEKPFYLQASQEAHFKHYKNWCISFKEAVKSSIQTIREAKGIAPQTFEKFLLEWQTSLPSSISSPTYYDYYLEKISQEISQDLPKVYSYTLQGARTRLREKLQQQPEIALNYFYQEIIYSLIELAGEQISTEYLQRTLMYYQAFVPALLYEKVASIIQSFLDQQSNKSEKYLFLNITKKTYIALIKEINTALFATHYNLPQQDEVQAQVASNFSWQHLGQQITETGAQIIKLTKQHPRTTVLGVLGIALGLGNWITCNDKIIWKNENLTLSLNFADLNSFAGNTLTYTALNYITTNTFLNLKFQNSLFTTINVMPYILLPVLTLTNAQQTTSDITNQIGPNPGEFQVNTYTFSDQLNSAITSLSNGNFAVTWQSVQDPDGSWGIYTQIFSPNGTKIGPELQVNTYTTETQDTPAIANLSNGGFVIAWESNGQDPDGSWGIYAQIFSPNGTKIGPELQVNTYITGAQYAPTIIGLFDGNFAVTWISTIQDPDSSVGIYAQIFSPSGAKIGTEFQVNTYIPNIQSNPVLACLSNESFVAAWSSIIQDPDDSQGIYAQIFSSNGTKIGTEFPVNTHIPNTQEYPAITSLSGGNFIVAWVSAAQDPDGSYGIYAQIFSSNGTKISPELRVNDYIANIQTRPAITSLLNNNFIVTWQSVGQDPDSSLGIYAQIFSPNGTKIGPGFRVNSYITNNQHSPDIASLFNGNFVITWDSERQDGNATGVYGAVFNPNNIPATTAAFLPVTTGLPFTNHVSPSSDNSTSTIILASVLATSGIVGLTICAGLLLYFYFKKQKKQIADNIFESVELSDDLDENQKLKGIVTEHKVEIGGKYYLLASVNQQQAKKIEEETGYKVKFKEGEIRASGILGEGHFSKVIIAQDKKTKNYAAAKEIKNRPNEPNAIALSIEESELQKQFTHPNILPLYNYTEIKEDKLTGIEHTLYQFTPIASYGSGTDLKVYLARCPNEEETLKIRVILKIAKELLQGFAVLHKANIFHLDFKPDNFLIDKDTHIMISDFGRAKKSKNGFIDEIEHRDQNYFSPEQKMFIKTKKPYNGSKADMWALGLALYELATEALLFQDEEEILLENIETQEQLNSYLLKKPYLNNPAPISLWRLIIELLQLDPAQRPSAEDALKMDVFLETQTMLIMEEGEFQKALYYFKSLPSKEKIEQFEKEQEQYQSDQKRYNNISPPVSPFFQQPRFTTFVAPQQQNSPTSSTLQTTQQRNRCVLI